MNKKNLKRSSLLLAALMMLSAAGCSNNAASNNTVANNNNNGGNTASEKPAKITAMVDIMDVSDENGRAEVTAKYKELTGIELEIIQPVHNQYYEKVNLAFASGDLPDVIELAPSDNSAFLTYSSQGALVDITSMVEGSEILAKANQTLVNGMKVDGKLYGFPNDLGNGTVTLVRKDWLDNVGAKVPTNYNEYLDMLRKFTFNDPDKNGQNDTKGVTGAGLDNITDNYRYILDFMQDAVPGFTKKNGKWVDGFQEPEMKAAMERIVAAYKEGLIDQDIITNKTSTAREKVINGEVGVISYWAGTWNLNLQQKTEKIDPNAKIVTIPAIQEVSYINRVPAAYCITAACENPEAAFKYFIEFAHDGGEGQMLFTYGVEGLTYEIKDGKGAMLPQKVDPNTKFKKTFLDPSIPVIAFEKEVFAVDPLIKESSQIFQSKMVQAQMPAITDTYIKMNADIIEARSTTFSKILLGEYTIEEGLAQYAKKVKEELKMDTILQEMNAK